jgi:hypothetical protein
MADSIKFKILNAFLSVIITPMLAFYGVELIKSAGYNVSYVYMVLGTVSLFLLVDWVVGRILRFLNLFKSSTKPLN